jgi:hypothetical protein
MRKFVIEEIQQAQVIKVQKLLLSVKRKRLREPKRRTLYEKTIRWDGKEVAPRSARSFNRLSREPDLVCGKCTSTFTATR